jgi:hypothetical protein
MNNELTSNIHIYKPKRWILALNIFSLFFMVIVMGIPLIAFVLMIVSFFQAEKALDTFAIVFGCILTPIIVLLAFNIVQITINTVKGGCLITFCQCGVIENRVNEVVHGAAKSHDGLTDVDELTCTFTQYVHAQ